MKFRGGYRFSTEYLHKMLGFPGEIYAVEIDPSGAVVFWCHGAQDELIVREGEIAPIMQTTFSWGTIR